MNPPTYTTADSLQIAQQLEPVFASEMNMHIAIGGSCVYRGNSTKDIDIFIYPHNHEVVINRPTIVAKLKQLGFLSAKMESGEYTQVPNVYVSKCEKTGRRVDFFFLQRHRLDILD